VDRDQGEPALHAFELSESLVVKWLAAGYSEKRKLLKGICSNLRLDRLWLCHETNKPSDVLVEGLSVLSNRGDKTPAELSIACVTPVPMRGW
jgi:hypothetical protein